MNALAYASGVVNPPRLCLLKRSYCSQRLMWPPCADILSGDVVRTNFASPNRATIHGELLQLGIDVSQASVAKYLVRPRRPPSQSWRTFLTNHVQQIMAADCFVVATGTGRLLFVLVMLPHHRRRVVHVAVTAHPTAAWTAQQLRAAFPWDDAPRYVIRFQ